MPCCAKRWGKRPPATPKPWWAHTLRCLKRPANRPGIGGLAASGRVPRPLGCYAVAIVKWLLSWLLHAAALLLIAHLIPGVEVVSYAAALWTALLLTVFQHHPATGLDPADLDR